ncbi:hypothetical protein C8R47DRAFT_1208720 [Mycena vitilis]|nr:hypothetical protein C8R47DRAFT_1208720 [Mycena vitilis]
MLAPVASDVWTLATPIETIFSASKAAGDMVVPIRTQVPAAVLGDHPTVVVKWSWISRAAHGSKAERSPPKFLRRMYCREIEKLGPVCYGSVLENLTDAELGGCDRRAFRILVEKELQPLTKLTDPHELAVAFKGIIRCHYWLYDAAKILHRDISVSNLMSQLIGGEVYGVLNDFDLAIILTAPQLSTSVQRTGSKPYMAMDLLVPEPPKHLYRHDLESFLYVLVFLTCTIVGSPLADWKNLGMSELADQKHKVLSRTLFPLVKPGFERPFGFWIIDLRVMFGEGITAFNVYTNRRARALLAGGSEPVFDSDTLDDSVTYAKFAAALEYTS